MDWFQHCSVKQFLGQQEVLDSLSDMYELLQEEDMWSGLWQKHARYRETNVAIAYEQQGFFEQAQVLCSHCRCLPLLLRTVLLRMAKEGEVGTPLLGRVLSLLSWRLPECLGRKPRVWLKICNIGRRLEALCSSRS